MLVVDDARHEAPRVDRVGRHGVVRVAADLVGADDVRGLQQVLLHEMVHLVALGNGAAFRAELARTAAIGEPLTQRGLACIERFPYGPEGTGGLR
jgi:hypothetical protein